MKNIQWTMNFKILFFLSFLLFLNGFMFLNIFSTLAGSSLFLFLIYAKLSFQQDFGEIELKIRIIESTLYVNHPCHIKTEIWYSGNPVFLQVKESIPKDTTISKGNQEKEILTKPGESITISYQMIFHHRGHHSFPPISMRINDRLNLFFIHIRIATETQVIVHSDPMEIQKAKRSAIPEDDSLILPSLVGSDEFMEFKGIRGFLPGDLIRNIDWKTTSRLQELVTRTYNKKVTLNTIFFLDVSRSMGRSKGMQTKLDHAIVVLLQLTHILLKLHHKIGFVAFDEHKIHTRIPLSFDAQPIIHACTTLPSSIDTISYSSNLPNNMTHLFTKESEEHQMFLSTITPYLSQTKKKVKNRLQTTGIYQAILPHLSSKQKKHLIFITDLETNLDSLYTSLSLLHTSHHKQWLLTLFSPWYNQIDQAEVNPELIEKIYRMKEKHDQILYKLRKKQIEVMQLEPRVQGMQVIKTIGGKR